MSRRLMGPGVPAAFNTAMSSPGSCLSGLVNQSPLLRARSRAWESALPPGVSVANHEPPLIIAVGGGKGGVGKSLVSANLAIRLAACGHQVLAMDLDVGGANLHSYFGLNAPNVSLADLLVYRNISMRDVMIPSGFSGLHLIAGGREESFGGVNFIDSDMHQQLSHTILKAKADLGIDVVILDLGAGSHRHTLDGFALAHMGLITVLPESTSIENAYFFLKIVLLRLIEYVGTRLHRAEAAEELRAALTAAEFEKEGRSLTGYAERLRYLAAGYPELVSATFEALSGRTVGFLVNQVRSQRDIDVGRSMELITGRYFGFTSRYCGFLNYDEAAWKSLRNRRPLAADFPHATLTKRFAELSKNILTHLGF